MTSENPMTRTDRTVRVRRILWIVFALNLLVAAAKYLWGLFSGSTSMQADGIHSVFDSLGNVIALIGVAIASRPADASHPYGHSKFETYGSLLIGVLLLIAAINVGTTAIGNLIEGTSAAEVSATSFTVMVITLAINICVSIGEHRAGTHLSSEMLKADASHTLSDAFVSIGVIIGLAFVALGYPAADSIAALAVCLFILIAAAGVFKRGIDTLSDHSRIPTSEIEAIAERFEDIRDIHRIRTRGTESAIYCDLHILVDPDMSVKKAHSIADELADTIEKENPNICEVLVHIEPDTEEERRRGES